MYLLVIRHNDDEFDYRIYYSKEKAIDWAEMVKDAGNIADYMLFKLKWQMQNRGDKLARGLT